MVKGVGYDWSVEAVEGVRFSFKVGGGWRVLFSFSDSIYFFLFSFLFVFEYFLFFFHTNFATIFFFKIKIQK